MKAHLIDTHFLVPRSRSSAKVKVKYQGNVSQKMGVLGALVVHKHILFSNGFIPTEDSTSFNPFPNKPLFVCVCSTRLSLENTVGKRENAHNRQYVLFRQYVLRLWRTLPPFI